MTVYELLEALQGIPHDALVVIMDPGGGDYTPLEGISYRAEAQHDPFPFRRCELWPL